MNRSCIALLSLPLITACASSGSPISQRQVDALRPGHSRLVDIERSWGPPTLRQRGPDGSVILIYSHSRSQIHPATFVPIVGLVAGGADITTRAVSLHFGPDGVLISTSESEAHHPTRMGPSSGG